MLKEVRMPYPDNAKFVHSCPHYLRH